MEKQPKQLQMSDSDILALPTVKCECGNMTFDAGVVFKKISAIVSETGEEEKIPMNLMFCKACGKIPQALYEPEVYALFPDELKTIKN